MTREAIPLAVIFLLIFAATATGIFYHSEGSPIQSISIRGQPVTFQGSGLYKFNPAYFAREGVIWDAVNLFIALPFVRYQLGCRRQEQPPRQALPGRASCVFLLRLPQLRNDVRLQ